MQGRLRDGRVGSRAFILVVAVGAAGVGCGASSGGSGPFISGEGGSSSATGGSTMDAAVTSGFGGSGDSTGSGGSSSGRGGTTGEGGSVGADGGVASGGATGAGGASSAKGGSTGSGGTSSAGHGGTTGSGGSTGSGGTVATGSGGSSGAAGRSGTGGSTTSAFCPSNAIFCADFEEASGVPNNDPVGSATFEDPTESGATFGGTSGVMVLDTTAPYAGLQSLKVNPSSAVSARALAIAVPSTFWVRLYIKSDQAIGQMNENSFFGAGTNPVPASGNYVYFSEQSGCVVLDKGGMLFPTSTRTCGTNSALTANAWHCLVAEFDGATGDVQVFSGATSIINAVGWAPANEAFNTFELGYFADNPNGATVWYDDVVVSASPLTCP